MTKNLMLLIGGALVIVVVGMGTGYYLSRGKNTSMMVGPNTEMVQTDKEAGLKECKGDKATGKLDKTSGKEQGTHKLVRDGGPSQMVYMVSSVVDLETFVGKKVEICGETQRVQGVPWFMDVNRVQAVE